MDHKAQRQIDQGKRLTKLIQELKLSSRQFALGLPMDTSQLSKIERGELGISYPIAKKINGKYKIDVEWLMEGRGVEPVWKNVPNDQGKTSLLPPPDTFEQALIKTMLDEIIKIKAKVFGGDVEDYLDEVYQNTRLILKNR